MATTNLGKVSVTPKGEYDPLITYERLDIISHNGSSYIVKQASTGVTPIEGEFYALIAEKGDGGSFVKKAYKTYAAMDADKVNIPANSSVDVTNDPDESKNGAYIYDGVAFTRSQYDSKVVTDKIIADTAVAVQDAIRDVAIDANLVTDALTTVVPLHSGSTSMTQLDKNRESISVMDFFTKSELIAYRANKKTFDAYRPLQDFLTYISVNDVGTAYFSGSFSISQGLVLGIGVGAEPCLTKLVIGSPKITALAAIDEMLVIQCGIAFTWSGTPTLTGTGGTSIASRTCRTGVRIGGNYSNRSNFTGFDFYNFGEWGLEIHELTTLNYFGAIRASSCGSSLLTGGLSLLGNISTRVNVGTTTSLNQYTEITVNVLPPENLTSFAKHIIYEGELYNINEIDRATNKIKVFPWLDPSKSAANFSYKYGGAVNVEGSDAGVIGFDRIDAVRCGTGIAMGSLYGSNIGRLCSQYCASGLDIGKRATGAFVGFNIDMLYMEGNTFDIVVNTRAPIGGNISSEQALQLHKVVDVINARTSEGKLLKVYSGFSSINLRVIGQALAWEKQGDNGLDYAGNVAVDVTGVSRDLILNKDTTNILLTAPDIEKNRLFGYDSAKVTIIGKTKDAPTGSVTFNAPLGWTVNGGSTAVFSGFVDAANFKVHANISSKVFRVVSLNNKPYVIVTYDAITDLAIGASLTSVYDVAGVNMGDIVAISIDRPLGGLSMRSYVSAAGKVTIVSKNETDALFNLARATMRIKVL